MSEDKPASAISPVLVQQRVIEWDADGNPVVAARAILGKQHLTSLYFAISAQPYSGPDAVKYPGMTNAEVMVRKAIEHAAASGDINEIERVMDRLLGKPKWIGEQTTYHATYEDVLRQIAAKVVAKEPLAPGADPYPVVDKSVFGDLA